MTKISKAVTILTGFLGAGKTTYLNHLIQSNPDVRYAIIENEFGEEGIDSELILRPEDGIVEMNNGCLCCTLNDNLYDILNDLFDRRDEFDEIIIEATGVADPTGLAEPFTTHPLIKEHFPLKGTICLVDTEQIEDQLESTEEALSQITFSDLLLLNKTDLVYKDYMEEVKAKLRTINPLAEIMAGSKDEFPQFDLSEQIKEIEKDLKKQVSNEEKVERLDIKAPHHHHHHKHTEDITSLSFTFDQAFDHQQLYHHLFVYLMFQSKGLYRIKGILSMEGNDQKVILQTVGKRMTFDEKEPWDQEEKRESIIVFIGKDLKEKGLRQLLEKALIKEPAKQ